MTGLEGCVVVVSSGKVHTAASASFQKQTCNPGAAQNRQAHNVIKFPSLEFRNSRWVRLKIF